MKRFFTSDWHLHSTNILKYAKRQFPDAKSMDEAFIANCNLKADKADTVFHVGDFILSSPDRHHENYEDKPYEGACSAEEALCKLRSNFVLIAGNHDGGHNSDSAAKSMTIDLNHNYRNVTVAHYPSYHELYRYVGNGNRNTFNGMHVHLCGHVHDSWILHYDSKHNVLNINVGIDVWDYKPVEDTTLTDLLDFIKNAKVKMPKNVLTTDELLAWREMEKKHTEAARIFRKQARYAKKGLTPEICEQRKIAAMKAKGLI